MLIHRMTAVAYIHVLLYPLAQGCKGQKLDESRGLPIASILIPGIPPTLRQEGTGDQGLFHLFTGGDHLSMSNNIMDYFRPKLRLVQSL